MRGRPDISIVIAATDSAEAVARTMASLGTDVAQDSSIEIIVVAPIDRIAFQPRSTATSWIKAEPGAGVPRLRRIGLDHSRGEIVVMTEDSCIFVSDWAASWRGPFADRGVVAATGPVEPGMGDRLIDWAVFGFEYGSFVEPVSPPARLAGNNFAFRRSIAEQLDPDAIEESLVDHLARKSGGRIVLAQHCVASHVRNYSLSEAIRDRMRLGREFGRLRAGRTRSLLRGATLVVGPLIWLVQTIRLLAIGARSNRHRARFFEAAPVTLGLLTAWSVGEWLGWMTACSPLVTFHKRRERADPRPGQATALVAIGPRN
jgi:hypothetical protein